MNSIELMPSGHHKIHLTDAITTTGACPSAESGYAQKPWEPIQANPNPLDAFIIYTAQSILTMDGKIGPVLPVNQAQDVINWHRANPRGNK